MLGLSYLLFDEDGSRSGRPIYLQPLEYLLPEGVTVIEWAERIYDLRFTIYDLKKVQIEVVSETERRIVYDDFGA